jgi:flagellar protein FliO/FliZ
VNPFGLERDRTPIDKEVDMRPIGRFVCCVTALTACVATAQNNELGYPTPSIHNSGQRANAIPLPALPNSNAPATGHLSNAAWVDSPTGQANANQATGSQATGNSNNNAAANPAQFKPAQATPAQGNLTQSQPAQGNVIPASYTAPAANSNPATLDQPAPKRTPLNSKKIDSLAEDKRTGSNTLQMLFSIGSSLLIVLGLFLGVAWCYRKTLNTSLGGIPKQVVSVLGRTAIAPRQQLVLVRFGSKLVLVSMNQGETRTLSEITDPIEVDRLAGNCESHQPHSLTNSFRTILNQSGGAV